MYALSFNCSCIIRQWLLHSPVLMPRESLKGPTPSPCHSSECLTHQHCSGRQEHPLSTAARGGTAAGARLTHSHSTHWSIQGNGNPHSHEVHRGASPAVLLSLYAASHPPNCHSHPRREPPNPPPLPPFLSASLTSRVRGDEGPPEPQQRDALRGVLCSHRCRDVIGATQQRVREGGGVGGVRPGILEGGGEGGGVRVQQ